ncbi:MAG: hypothetical protein M9898_02105 [Chitinophagaceae bacterium]|nr:hypothetical protein [Chitinophagaceae bacterium]
MKNKLSDLNNHLFAQLERLGDENLTGEDLIREIDRAKAMSGVATQIVNGTKVVVDAMKLVHKGDAPKVIAGLLGDKMEE